MRHKLPPPAVTCRCGACRRCLRREYMRRWRAEKVRRQAVARIGCGCGVCEVCCGAVTPAGLDAIRQAESEMNELKRAADLRAVYRQDVLRHVALSPR